MLSGFHGGPCYRFSVLQVAFKTGDFKRQVIFIGGLTDGFLATSYVSYCSFISKLCVFHHLNENDFRT